MAHVEKFAISAIGHMCDHYERGRDVERSNENIDSERTGLNYNLAPARSLSQVDFIRQRISEVKCQKRADVKVMCDWVITIPKDFLAAHPDREREFFERTYEFLAERYGEKNVVSAYVHMDEITPHMHFAFVPVTADKRKDIEKVSAKEVLTRADLRTFHNDLQEHLERSLGVEVNVQNEATKGGNKAIAELKRESAKERLEKLQEKVHTTTENINFISRQYQERFNALETSYTARKAFLASETIQTMVQPEKRFKSGLFGNGEEKVTLRAADFDRLQQQAAEVKKCKEYCETAEGYYKKWADGSSGVFAMITDKDKQIKKLEKQIEDGRNENAKLRSEIERLKEQEVLNNAVLEQVPEAKRLKEDIIDLQQTEKLMAIPDRGHLTNDGVFIRELQRQVREEGKTAATLDYTLAAAVVYDNCENVFRTADTLREYAPTKLTKKQSERIAEKGRDLCNVLGRGR